MWESEGFIFDGHGLCRGRVTGIGGGKTGSNGQVTAEACWYLAVPDGCLARALRMP